MLIQIRLTPETVKRLDTLVRDRGASGRAAVIEGLLSGEVPAAQVPRARTGHPRLSPDGLTWL
jgi:hypothetical protein